MNRYEIIRLTEEFEKQNLLTIFVSLFKEKIAGVAQG